MKLDPFKKIVGHRRNSKERIVFGPEDVLYFRAHLAQVFVRLETEEELIVRLTLKEILNNLDSSFFAQTHKAYIINLNKISKISPLFNGNYEITLKNTTLEFQIPLSRRYAQKLKQLLRIW